MTQEPKQFTIADPSGFDGDVFEVAERAFQQANAIVHILRFAVDRAYVMARNAEMERRLIAGDDPDAAGFPDTPQGKQLHKIQADLADAEKKLGALTKAAGFNPKAR